VGSVDVGLVKIEIKGGLTLPQGVRVNPQGEVKLGLFWLFNLIISYRGVGLEDFGISGKLKISRS